MRKTRLPRNLKDATWTITDTASTTKTPPTTTNRISFLLMTATIPSAAPSPRLPTSPMKIWAG